ncbi:hypothetical protein [Myroides odoratus]|uniref:hypothetical protein n=1 Tax=Myroides odoratus TaxID=256 RepID=UPI0039AF5FF3
MLKLVFLILLFQIKVYAQDKIIAEILNTTVKDGDTLKIRVSNQTNQAIFLPWEVSVLSYKMLMEDFFRTSVFIPKISLKDIDTNELVPFSGEGTSMSGGFVSFDEWTTLLDNRKVEDFILLKSGEEKEITIPFKLCWSTDADNFYMYSISQNNYNLILTYHLDQELMKKFINTEVLQQLKKKGYVPFFEKIESNQIPLIID